MTRPLRRATSRAGSSVGSSSRSRASSGSSPVRIELWDEPEVAPRDGTVRMRILDGKALWQLIVNPDLHFGDLYSSGRIQVRGDLLTLLLEAYRYTAEHPAIGAAARARPEACARSVRLEAQHSSPLRHRQRFLQAVARPRGAAVHVRVFRRSRNDDRASAASENASRVPQAAAQARRARRRGRRRLGRLRAVHGARTTARASRASTFRKNRSHTRALGQDSSGSTARSSSSRTTTATSRARTTRSSRSACSSTSARATTRISARS